MVTIDQISNAQARIIELINVQCSQGAQLDSLPDGTSACGQFFGDKAEKLKQRGIYGTSAAIRLLTYREDDLSYNLVRKLISYLQIRFKSELRDSKHKELTKITHDGESDEHNVIKLSEILFSLSFVKPAICNTEEFKTNLSKRLLAGMIDNRGWAHFSDSPNSRIELLPTAYAVQALMANGYRLKLDKALKYLEERLKQIFLESFSSEQTDISIYIFCLYVLVFLEDELDNHKRDLYLKELKPLWRILEPLFNFDLEQNIEYWYANDNFYVRVPWQIYFIAISYQLAPLKIFGSSVVQRRLQSILNDVLNDGFKYPHSGIMLSTRTNAILFDILGIIKKSYNRSIGFVIYNLFDRARNLLSRPSFTYAGYLASVILASISIYQWLAKSASLGDLAPEFLGAILIALFSSRKARK